MGFPMSGNGMTGKSLKDASTIGPRGQARCQALLDAASALFMEKGFEQTTLNDIFQRAGGSRTTLYEHFGDKAGLFRVMMEENSERFLDMMAAVADAERDEPVESALTRFGLHFAQCILDPRTTAILRILVAEGNRIPDIADAFFRDGPDAAVGRFAAYLRGLADAGTLRIADPEVAAQAFMGMTTGNLLVRRLILPDLPVPEAEVVDYVAKAVRLFLAGARPAA
ncbi:hypothetical protein [Azospirillum doebereinerae]